MLLCARFNRLPIAASARCSATVAKARRQPMRSPMWRATTAMHEQLDATNMTGTAALLIVVTSAPRACTRAQCEMGEDQQDQSRSFCVCTAYATGLDPENVDQPLLCPEG